MGAGDLPVHVPLVTRPMGIFASLNAARRNLLAILPDIATRQPMVSGRTAKRWHMVMDPGAIRAHPSGKHRQLPEIPWSRRTC